MACQQSKMFSIPSVMALMLAVAVFSRKQNPKTGGREEGFHLSYKGWNHRLTTVLGQARGSGV